MSEWISVDERLPNCGDECLVYCDGIAGAFLIIGKHDSDHDSWLETWQGAELHSVTHWMPLPEPPK